MSTKCFYKLKPFAVTAATSTATATTTSHAPTTTTRAGKCKKTFNKYIQCINNSNRKV